jgi:SPP1 gp7 family putative phage head morphogenesis protein
MPDIVTIAQRFRLALLAEDEAAAALLAAAYKTIWAGIALELEKLTLKIEAAREAGEEVSTHWLAQQRRYTALLNQTKVEMTKFTRIAETVITRKRRSGVERGIKDAKSLVTLAAEASGVDIAFNKLPRAAVEAMVGMLSRKSPLAALLSVYPTLAQQRVRDELTKGIAIGRNPRVIARRITEALEGNRTRAQMLSRTEMMRAYRTAQIETYQNNRDVIRGWRWSAAKSSRTCVVCLSRDGKIYTIEEPMPAHVSCRCVMVPLVVGAPTPRRQTAAEWFKEQDADTKRSILGPRAYELYREEEVDLEDFDGLKFDSRWGKSVYRRPLREILGETI